MSAGLARSHGLRVELNVGSGGFGGHGHGKSRMQQRWAERWERMTPEEREKFRHGIRGRCGSFREPPSEAGERAN